MPLLFSYGTLQLESVQLSTFGRRLDGWPDSLPGYTHMKLEIKDAHVATALGKTHHDNVARSRNDEDRVEGTAFEIADDELASVDEYEARFSYRRVNATLVSGKRAWVYIYGATGREQT